MVRPTEKERRADEKLVRQLCQGLPRCKLAFCLFCICWIDSFSSRCFHLLICQSSFLASYIKDNLESAECFIFNIWLSNVLSSFLMPFFVPYAYCCWNNWNENHETVWLWSSINGECSMWMLIHGKLFCFLPIRLAAMARCISGGSMLL